MDSYPERRISARRRRLLSHQVEPATKAVPAAVAAPRTIANNALRTSR